MVGLGSAGRGLTMCDCVSGGLDKSPGAICMSLVPPLFALMTSCGPLLAAVDDAALALSGAEQLLLLVVVVVE